MNEYYIHDNIWVKLTGAESGAPRYVTEINGVSHVVMDVTDDALLVVPIDYSKAVTLPEELWGSDWNTEYTEEIDFANAIKVPGMLHDRHVMPPGTEFAKPVAVTDDPNAPAF